MHIQNFVDNVPAKDIKSEITRTQEREKYIYNLYVHNIRIEAIYNNKRKTEGLS